MTDEILTSLARSGLIPAGARPPLVRLAGGVSSDVFRVDLASGSICVKRALPRLRVEAEWCAPVERSSYEAAWLRAVAPLQGPVVPRVLAEDPQQHLFAMTYFEPGLHPVWKTELAAGRVDVGFAATVGQALACVHAATADSSEIAARFATDELFQRLRLDPYLGHTARAHPDLASRLAALAADTLARKVALVHGDISPKNILQGPSGPVFLDAECAWYGDPAFDIAFCATHLLLKTVWNPVHAEAYLASYTALTNVYLDGVTWETRDCLSRRAAALVSGLLLARVDGKSPVEYLINPGERAVVRQTARALIVRESLDLKSLLEVWRALATYPSPQSPAHLPLP
jgi:aminoglycoside phosphotransferase (APT) family kinase protein